MKKEFFSNLPLVFSLLTTLIIVSTEAPSWASSLSLLLIIWRFLYEKFNIYKLSSKITPIFGILFFVIVYIQHRTIFGQEESLTILIGLMATTILNYEKERDLLFLVLLGFLMLVLKSVFSIDFFWILPALFSFFGLWVALLSNSKLNAYKYVLNTTLRSLPILIILFVVFPRIVLFQLNNNIKPVARSGFNAELRPGQFSNVALSNELVFRAQFINDYNIDSGQLYWRGLVLTESNGFLWSKDKTEHRKIDLPESAVRSILQYNVFLEPQSNNNIFVLDIPIKIISSSQPFVEGKHSSFSLQSNNQKLVHFEAQAVLTEGNRNPNVLEFNDTDLKHAELPPLTKKWVNEKKIKYPKLEDRLNQLNTFFSQPSFKYTLNPDIYDNDLDKFLFVKKTGYCEHFAAAYATLARALGIPARVVIGYQGGTYNDISNFWKISQRDAHAWVEVGLNQTWFRRDPTALVAPLRFAIGSSEFFTLSDEEQFEFSKKRSWYNYNQLRNIYLSTLAFWDSVNFKWTLFLLNYDIQTQLELLRSLNVFKVFIFCFIVLIIGILYYKKKSKLIYRNQPQEMFSIIEKWARQNQILYPDSSTPLQILDLILSQYPASRTFIEMFRNEYISTIYQENPTQINIRILKKEWHLFCKTASPI